MENGTSNIAATIDNVRFQGFTRVLKEKIGYNPDNQVILYQSYDGKGLKITNKRSWKAALDEMHGNGSSRFIFNIGQTVNSIK